MMFYHLNVMIANQLCKKFAIFSDKIAELLVNLYADYEYRTRNTGYANINPNYAKAVAIAIRMLTD